MHPPPVVPLHTPHSASPGPPGSTHLSNHIPLGSPGGGRDSAVGLTSLVHHPVDPMMAPLLGPPRTPWTPCDTHLSDHVPEVPQEEGRRRWTRDPEPLPRLLHAASAPGTHILSLSARVLHAASSPGTHILSLSARVLHAAPTPGTHILSLSARVLHAAPAPGTHILLLSARVLHAAPSPGTHILLLSARVLHAAPTPGTNILSLSGTSTTTEPGYQVPPACTKVHCMPHDSVLWSLRG